VVEGKALWTDVGGLIIFSQERDGGQGTGDAKSRM